MRPAGGGSSPIVMERGPQRDGALFLEHEAWIAIVPVGNGHADLV